jgi:methylated-DNA-[protein]-cysteine S-methyltransferase
MTLHAGVIHTPVGALLAMVRDDGALTALPFLATDEDARAVAKAHAAGAAVVFDQQRVAHVAYELDEYFEGRRRSFTLRTAPEGTEFQRKVWRALEQIPFGETMGYAELARRIDSPNASRAVGRANGSNPIPVIVPCHRVIGANGDLTGYGGGLDKKRLLLQLEGALSGVLTQ